MLCSHCSANVKPVVAIDIDGTLGDYHTHFLLFAQDWLGRHTVAEDVAGLYDGTGTYNEWFQAAFGVDYTTFRQIKLAYRQGGQKRTMPVFPGAMEITHTLRRAGAEVWLTTTRPHDRYDRVDPDTREWLDRHQIEFDGLIYEEDKYQVLRDRVEPGRVVACLDDEIEQLYRFHDQFPKAIGIIRQTRYNKADDPRFHPWASAQKTLQMAMMEMAMAVDNWERNNG